MAGEFDAGRPVQQTGRHPRITVVLVTHNRRWELLRTSGGLEPRAIARRQQSYQSGWGW